MGETQPGSWPAEPDEWDMGRNMVETCKEYVSLGKAALSHGQKHDEQSTAHTHTAHSSTRVTALFCFLDGEEMVPLVVQIFTDLMGML